jgi:autoinducer 2-degrading protein
MYSIFVTINVKPEHIETFKEASLGDAQGSTRDEPGCFRFDMHQDPDISSRFYLYEVYRDEEAFEAHLEAPHFIEWRDTVKPFFDGDIQKIVMQTVFPSDDGWEKQKSALLNW